jgi:hypothetical protein
VSQLCPGCGPDRLHEDDETICGIHIRPLEPYVEGPGAAADEPGAGLPTAEPGPPPTACWNCGTEVPHPDNTECLNPGCHRLLTPPTLLIRLPTGQVELRDGRAALGRVGPHAELFRSYPNVSRHHAVVGAEAGKAWVEPVPTPNGTVVDGVEIPASERHPLLSNQRIRFGLDAEGTVTVYSR